MSERFIAIPTIEGGELIIPRKALRGCDSRVRGVQVDYEILVEHSEISGISLVGKSMNNIVRSF